MPGLLKLKQSRASVPSGWDGWAGLWPDSVKRLAINQCSTNLILGGVSASARFGKWRQ